ncbi:MAG: hypothetical protein KJT03_04190 [Verrucomicrobiae bacterium]|nr:hypothetical protein [Verrucomicrobiae bacterium]
MVNPHIKKLLILQDRDLTVRRLQDQLEAIPHGIQKFEVEIQAETQALEASKSRLQQLEIKRKDLDNQVGSAEDQINRYRNQQLQVKKNEEYQALTHEITQLQEKISGWEEEEIALMLDIDSEKEVFSKRESVYDEAVAQIRRKISQLQGQETELRVQLSKAEEALQACEGTVTGAYASVYAGLSKRTRLPVVVPLELQTCQGCHLRVSNDTLEQARRGEELTTCDNCGRIVYFAS